MKVAQWNDVKCTVYRVCSLILISPRRTLETCLITFHTQHNNFTKHIYQVLSCTTISYSKFTYRLGYFCLIYVGVGGFQPPPSWFCPLNWDRGVGYMSLVQHFKFSSLKQLDLYLRLGCKWEDLKKVQKVRQKVFKNKCFYF